MKNNGTIHNTGDKPDLTLGWKSKINSKQAVRERN
jgi:hypothetical protein